MKKALWGLGIVVVGAGLFGLGWISHGGVGQAPATSNDVPVASASTSPNNPPPNPPPSTANTSFISQSDFQKLRAARDAVLQANPDLAAEYKQIIKAMDEEQKELDAAMIKADPKVAPLVAKLIALREHNGGHAAAVASGPR